MGLTCLTAVQKVRHLPVDSTNGKRHLRLVSRLRTETTAALPGEDRLERFIYLDCFILTQVMLIN